MPLDAILRQLIQQHLAYQDYIVRVREKIPPKLRAELGDPLDLLEPSTKALIDTLVAYAQTIQQLQQQLQANEKSE